LSQSLPKISRKFIHNFGYGLDCDLAYREGSPTSKVNAKHNLTGILTYQMTSMHVFAAESTS